MKRIEHMIQITKSIFLVTGLMLSVFTFGSEQWTCKRFYGSSKGINFDIGINFDVDFEKKLVTQTENIDYGTMKSVRIDRRLKIDDWTDDRIFGSKIGRNYQSEYYVFQLNKKRVLTSTIVHGDHHTDDTDEDLYPQFFSGKWKCLVRSN
jgi:hypothetical protein